MPSVVLGRPPKLDGAEQLAHYISLSIRSDAAQLARFGHPHVAIPLDNEPAEMNGSAGALALIYPDTNGLKLLLTKRGEWMDYCPGRIEFPGGTRDGSESYLDAALREAEEEAGVAAETVRLLGELTPLFNCESRFWVKIYLGWSDLRPELRRQERELAELIEIPLREVLDPAARTLTDQSLGGQIVQVPTIAAGGYQIWGTAAISICEISRSLRDYV